MGFGMLNAETCVDKYCQGLSCEEMWPEVVSRSLLRSVARAGCLDTLGIGHSRME